MSTLHIIGNGFDLAHGIRSRYEDFREYAWHHCKNSWNLGLLERCYPDINPVTGELELWSDLEKALGNLDFQAAMNETTEDIELEEDHEGRYQAQKEDAPGYFLTMMFEDFHDIFNEWVNQIDLSDVQPRDLGNLDKSGKFLTFNYTETLERFYGIQGNMVEHIHGKRNTNDELVVGHCSVVFANDRLPEDPEIYDYQAFDDIARIVNGEHKNVLEIIAANHSYWHSLSDVDRVVVYGHSLSDVDAPYFKEVIRHIHLDSEWLFSVHYGSPKEQEAEENRVNDFINRMGLDPFKCKTFSM